MYVRGEEYNNRSNIPQNYNGSLYEPQSEGANCNDCAKNNVKRYTIKRNKFVLCKDKTESKEINNTDNLILLGAFAFLYVGCEHTKENWILIGILAYLFFINNKD